ncbi:MAG TPA: KTSC domain-containing protein [Polyangiaceae bacterium]|nr:KTSC domain-containing protein [Polyangiaceae bacterium]
MLRQVVDSQSLRSIGYDKRTRTLEVEFKSGSLYRYANVPLAVWSDLLQAQSKGRFFQQHVRDHFPTTRL